MKKVLITGSTQGIGKALAKAFVKEGYEVIVHCSKDIEKAERIRAEIGAKSAVVCDLSNMDEVNGLYTYVRKVCKVNAVKMKRLSEELGCLLDKNLVS